MADEPLFPVLPEDIHSLTDAELDDSIAKHESGIARIATGEAFADEEEPTDRNQRMEILRAAKDALLQLRDLKKERDEETATYDAEVAEVVAEAGVELAKEDEPPKPDDDNGDEEGAPAELAATTVEGDGVEKEGIEVPADGTTVELEGEALTASGLVPERRTYRNPPPATPKRHQALDLGDGDIALKAAAGFSEVNPGTPLDKMTLAELTAEAIRMGTSAPPGAPFKVTIATANWADRYPEERRLSGEDAAADMGKLDDVRGRETLVASGGWCAPSEIRYDIGTIGTDERPVRDAFTAFNSTRGGLRYFHDLSIASTNTLGGITKITEAQAIAGGTPAQKNCVTIPCPSDVDVRAGVIATCLQAGNLQSIAFPELIAAWQALIAVQAARERDKGLLDAVKNDPQTKNVTAAAAYGAFPTTIHRLAELGAGYRSRHRLPANAVLRALAPAWLADLLVVDLVNRQFADYDAPVGRGDVAGLITRYTGVAVDWYLDSCSNPTDPQIFGTQTDNAAILAWPKSADVYLWPEGGIGYLDQGQLNIGLVRDSVLNQTNDVRFFAEVFENAFVLAAEVFQMTLSLCPDGTSAPPGAAITC